MFIQTLHIFVLILPEAEDYEISAGDDEDVGEVGDDGGEVERVIEGKKPMNSQTCICCEI